MKKLMIFSVLTLMSGAIVAQTSKVKDAEKLIEKNTQEARRYASEARQHTETMNDAYTWYVSGLIEQKDYNTEFLKVQMGQQANNDKMYKALISEVPYLLRTYEIESVPNAKGKIKLKYSKKAKELLQADYQMLLNAGSHYQQKQDYKTAAEAFEQYLRVRRHPMFVDNQAIATLDTTAYDVAYYATLMYHEVKEYDKAIKMALEFKDSPFKGEDIYQVLAASYQAKGDSAQLINALTEGRGKFPKSNYFTLNLAQIAFSRGQFAESEAYIEKALEYDPKNIVLTNFLAGLAEQQQQLDKALAWYLKSLEIKADDYDANYNLGRTYFNQAVEHFNNPNPTKLTDDKGREALSKAVPYLEAAYKQKPDQVYYILSNTYDRLGRKADYDRIMAAHQ